MPGLFLDHGLEDIEQIRMEEPRFARHREQSECKERIETLAEACEQKIVLQGIRLEPRRLIDLDLIVRGEGEQQPCVALLLVALHLDRLAQFRIRLECGGGGHRVGSDVLGGNRLLPERQPGEARAPRLRKLRPADALGHVVDMRVDEESRHDPPMLERAGLDVRSG